MRQQYMISRNVTQNELKIREYAILDKNFNNVESPMLQREDFSFLCEETYESEIIKNLISKGMNALIAVLKTDNMLPIEPYATRIAESIMTLYDSSGDSSVELFFDDADLISF